MTRIVVGRGNWKAQQCLEALVKYEMMKRSNVMTSDEALAEKYAGDYGSDNHIDLGDCQINLFPVRKWSFLAGLKAGKPKWHNLRENRNDLPPLWEGCERSSIRVVDEYDRIISYDYGSECWRDYEGDHLGTQPDFWCEIPMYTEESKNDRRRN